MSEMILCPSIKKVGEVKPNNFEDYKPSLIQSGEST